jgi:hypothetical protein
MAPGNGVVRRNIHSGGTPGSAALPAGIVLDPAPVVVGITGKDGTVVTSEPAPTQTINVPTNVPTSRRHGLPVELKQNVSTGLCAVRAQHDSARLRSVK